MNRLIIHGSPFQRMLAQNLGFSDPISGEYEPRVDAKQTPEGIVFTADLPGVKEEDIEISLLDDQLIIKGARGEDIGEKETRHITERRFGTFSRAFDVPRNIDIAKARAELKNGVLTLVLPIPFGGSESRKIPISN